uniref:Reverse transcriptase zinc-binding domain-containing protein n=1 Tax=Triticum urartu TaxID=4572 RepID=A0A8R7TFV3_TRIUA
MWLWLRGRIQTNDNLEIHGIPCNDACNLCDQEDESPLHLILKCSYARTVWQQVANWSDTPALATHAQETESIMEWSNEH